MRDQKASSSEATPVLIPGWQLVPVVPTPDMIRKAFRHDRYGYGPVAAFVGCDIYTAMLEAAPQPPPMVELSSTILSLSQFAKIKEEIDRLQAREKKAKQWDDLVASYPDLVASCQLNGCDLAEGLRKTQA